MFTDDFFLNKEDSTLKISILNLLVFVLARNLIFILIFLQRFFWKLFSVKSAHVESFEISNKFYIIMKMAIHTCSNSLPGR